MGKIQMVDREVQRPIAAPPPGTEVNVAADISSTKWVYGVRWQGEERYRLSTPAGLNHLEALIGRFQDCPIRFAYEACGLKEFAEGNQRHDAATTLRCKHQSGSGFQPLVRQCPNQDSTQV